MRKRKTYVRSIDAVFGKSDAYGELPDLIETDWVERRGKRLAFGAACGDVLGLSIERETVSWAVLGPRGPIASRTLDAPVFPIGGEAASREELERILTEAVEEAAAELANRSLAAVGVAWPAPIAPDGVPYDDGFAGATASWDTAHPRDVALAALDAAGVQVDICAESGEPIVELVNDADADLFYDARLGVGRGIGDLLGVKIGGGIGLSLLHSGHLVRGHAGRAGQIAHIKVRNEDFPLPEEWKTVRALEDLEACSCNGANCIARFATGRKIVEQLRDYDDAGTYNERGRKIEDDARRDVVTAVFGRAGRLLGQALLGPVLAVDPERIVVSAFPKNPNLLHGLRTALTEGTRVHLDPDDIVFSSVKRERTAAGAGWVAVEQTVIPRLEEAVANGAKELRRYELPYWLRTQVPTEDQFVSRFGPRYASGQAPA